MNWRERADLPRTDSRRRPEGYRPSTLDEALADLDDVFGPDYPSFD